MEKPRKCSGKEPVFNGKAKKKKKPDRFYCFCFKKSPLFDWLHRTSSQPLPSTSPWFAHPNPGFSSKIPIYLANSPGLPIQISLFPIKISIFSPSKPPWSPHPNPYFL